MRISWKKVARLMAEDLYQNEVIDTGMYEHYIGEWKDYSSKEDWIEQRLQNYIDELTRSQNER